MHKIISNQSLVTAKIPRVWGVHLSASFMFRADFSHHTNFSKNVVESQKHEDFCIFSNIDILANIQEFDQTLILLRNVSSFHTSTFEDTRISFSVPCP